MKKKTLYILLTILIALLSAVAMVFSVSAYAGLIASPAFEIWLLIELIGWLSLVLASLIATAHFLIQILKLKDGGDKR